jgi:hypothetical protein
MTAPQQPMRLRDWPEQLADLLAARLNAPFGWGVNDCCLFACDAVQALTGWDPAGPEDAGGLGLRGTYADMPGAARILADRGGVKALAVAAFGEPRELPLMAQRGDVVCVQLDGRDTLGIVAGTGHWCAPGSDGLVFRPMSEVVAVWAIGAGTCWSLAGA